MVLPPEADYSGIARNNEVRRNPGRPGNPPLPDPDVVTSLFYRLPSGLVDLSVLSRPQSLTQLTCSYDTENQTRYLSCDLGNPMKSGTSVRTQLFSVTSRVIENF